MVTIYIVYETNKNYDLMLEVVGSSQKEAIFKNFKKLLVSSYPRLQKCLFGAVTLTGNVDIDRYKYSGYGIEFD